MNHTRQSLNNRAVRVSLRAKELRYRENTDQSEEDNKAVTHGKVENEVKDSTDVA
ncbi:MAG: hypothetical protein HXK17_03690 [Alloprevotella sp.]|nr:hypothetical protein [Alloprevotella sp.]